MLLRARQSPPRGRPAGARSPCHRLSASWHVFVPQARPFMGALASTGRGKLTTGSTLKSRRLRRYGPISTALSVTRFTPRLLPPSYLGQSRCPSPVNTAAHISAQTGSAELRRKPAKPWCECAQRSAVVRPLTPSGNHAPSSPLSSCQSLKQRAADIGTYTAAASLPPPALLGTCPVFAPRCDPPNLIVVVPRQHALPACPCHWHLSHRGFRYARPAGLGERPGLH